MDREILWGPWLGCLLAVCAACGGNAGSTVDGSGGSHPGGASPTGGSNAGGAGSSGGSNPGGAGSSGGSNPGGSGGEAQPEACDCGSHDCRPAQTLVAEFCMGMNSTDLATYTERQGCDYVSFRLDYERGDRTYYYDAQGTLVASVADNAFAGGYSACGVIASCTGDIVRTCRLCRGSAFADDNVPDCPATIWE